MTHITQVTHTAEEQQLSDTAEHAQSASPPDQTLTASELERVLSDAIVRHSRAQEAQQAQ